MPCETGTLLKASPCLNISPATETGSLLSDRGPEKIYGQFKLRGRFIQGWREKRDQF